MVECVGSCACVLMQMSAKDLAFGDTMPRGYKSKGGADKEVWTAGFFKQVRNELDSSTGIMELAFKTEKYFGAGSLVIISRAGRNELIDNYCVLKGKGESQFCKTLRDAVYLKSGDDGTGQSFLNMFVNLVSKPGVTIAKEGFNFQDIIEWQRVQSPPSMLPPP